MDVDDISVSAYIEAARTRLVGLQGSGDRSWRDILERGLGDAYARGDPSALSRVVQLLVHLLEAQGRFDDALSEIDLALTVACVSPGALGSLTALKAAMLISRGDSLAALALANEASGLAAQHLDGHERLKTLALCEAVRFQALEDPVPTLSPLVAELVAQSRALDHLFLLSWLVPALAARGRVHDVAPQLRVMTSLARAQGAAFRDADVVVFQTWMEAVKAPPAEPLQLTREQITNSLAAWRMRCLEVWRLVRLREYGGADEALRRLASAARRLNSQTGGVDPWAAFVSAAEGVAGRAELAAPPAELPTLSSLGSALARAHGVAIAGNPALAERWLDFLGRLRREGIESSLECPVAIRRLQGLLALRSGKPTAARRYLDDAATWCAAAGMELEAEVAKLQGIELKGRLYPRQVRGWQLGDELTAVSARLSEKGIDPVPCRYAVQSAWNAGGSRIRTALLTAREIEILRQLAGGKTYGEAAAALGIAQPTVQTVAHRVYEKLGVNRKIDAIREAERLSLL